MITVQSAEELMNRQTLRGCGCLTHQLEYGVFFMINRRVLFSSLFLNGKLLKSLFLSTNLLQLNIFFYL